MIEDIEPGARRRGRDSIASASAASSISSPRAVLMMRTPFLHCANRSALKRCLVDGERRHVERDVVGARAEIVERHELHAERGGHCLPR